MKQARRLNLVFQGGGVKGIAYAGALKHFPSDICAIEAVGGTSAGSIVAALIAIGTKPADVQDFLKPSLFSSFLEPQDRARLDEILKYYKELEQIWTEQRLSSSAVRIFKAAIRLKKVKRHIEDLVAQRGAYSSVKLGAWLHATFRDLTFADIKTTELKIVAADIGSRSYKIFSKAGSANEKIADAVHASASIPFFFSPFGLGNRMYVDGGTLSNFPSFLFENSEFPTVGLRLLDVAPPPSVKSFFDFAKSTFFTMLEAHDKARSRPSRYNEIIIDTGDIAGTKFDLGEDEISRLLNAGKLAASSVDWVEWSSDHPIFEFFDSKPQEGLEFCIRQSGEIAKLLAQKGLRPEFLEEEMKIIYTINQDWSSRYQISYSHAVKGPIPIIAQGVHLFNIQSKGSVVDYALNISTDMEDFKVVPLPCSNKPTEKGFLVFFSPPIAESSGRREFSVVFDLVHDAAELLSKGKADIFPVSLARFALEHFVTLTVEIRISSELRKMDVAPVDDTLTPIMSNVLVEDPNGKEFKSWSFRSNRINLDGSRQIEIKISPRNGAR